MSLCNQCAALCCRYFALPIDNPETRRQYDDIRWYLVHENVVVFIEKKQWYIGIISRCKHLEADNRCGIYETRPRVCRSYSTDNCDYHGGEYDFEKLFTSAEQLWAYATETLRAERLAGKRRKPRKRKINGRPSVVAHLRPGGQAIPSGPAVSGGNGNGNGNGHPSARRGLSLPVLRG
ncbi:MAG TPA: YkgJ family cysteine cluster protein [Tepidisphaeraceae bacterium]